MIAIVTDSLSAVMSQGIGLTLDVIGLTLDEIMYRKYLFN